MPKFKDTIIAIVFITLVSAIFVAAVIPLERSTWAENVRAESSYETEGGENQSEPDFEELSAPLRILAGVVGSALKITLLMGVPGLITHRILRSMRRNGKRSAAGAAPS